MGKDGRDRLRSEGTGSSRRTLERARRQGPFDVRSRPASRRTGSSQHSSLDPVHGVTSDGLLRSRCIRHADDKKAREVRREDAKPVAKPAVPARSGFQKHHRVRTEPPVVKPGLKTRPPSGKQAPPAPEGGRVFRPGKNEAPSASTLDALVTRLNELEDARKDGDLDLPNGDRVRVTNLAKVFWPELGITKGELLVLRAGVAWRFRPWTTGHFR